MWFFLSPDNTSLDYIIQIENKIETLVHTADFHFIRNLETSLSNQLKKLQECLLKDDKNENGQFFSYFVLKSKLPNLILKLFSTNPEECQAPILIFLSILLENTQRNFDLFLSSNLIHSILSSQSSLKESNVSLTGNIVKSISNRISTSNIHLLFNKSSIDYPIFTVALSLEENLDPIICTVAKQTILNLFKSKDSHLRKSMLERNYFAICIGRLCNQFITIKSKSSNEQLNCLHRIIDDLYFLNDLISISETHVTESVSNNIIELLVLPMLLPNLLSTDHFESNLAAYGLLLISSEIIYPPIGNILKDFLINPNTAYAKVLADNLKPQADDSKIGTSAALLYAISNFSSYDSQLANDAERKLLDAPLATSLISILSSESSIHLSLFTKTVLIELLLYLFKTDVIYKDTPEIQILLDQYSSYTKRLLDPFLIMKHSQHLRYLFQYESNISSNLRLKRCFLNPRILIKSELSQTVDILTELDIALKNRLLFLSIYGAIPKLEIRDDNIFSGSLSTGDFIPCLAIFKRNPSNLPDRVYLCNSKLKFHIVKASPLLLGKGDVILSIDLGVIEVEEPKDNNNILQIYEKNMDFLQSRDEASIIGISGFNVVTKLELNHLADLVFPNPQNLLICKQTIQKAKECFLQIWLSDFKRDLNS
jgi:hypothetical protein